MTFKTQTMAELIAKIRQQAYRVQHETEHEAGVRIIELTDEAVNLLTEYAQNG